MNHQDIKNLYKQETGKDATREQKMVDQLGHIVNTEIPNWGYVLWLEKKLQNGDEI